MISNFFYQKNVDQLRERMRRIDRVYRLAFRVVFYGSLLIVGMQVFYNLLLLFMMTGAYFRETQNAPTNINWRTFFPDPMIYGVPPFAAILGYFSFHRKMRVVKAIFFLLNVAYLIACIVFLSIGYDSTSYICAILFSIAAIAVTIDCFRVDADDVLLSRIPGYPNFDPLLMQDIEPEPEAIEKRRYREKPAEALMNERDREYLEQNPESEAAIAERERQEIERDIAVENWLEEMLEPNKEKTE